MNLPDIVRNGCGVRNILKVLGPSLAGAKRRGQVELLLHGLGGPYEEFSPRNRFEPRVYLRVSAYLR